MADQSTLNKIVKGAGLLSIGLFASKLLTYAYRAVVAQLIGPSAYGQLSQAIAVASIGGTFAMLGLNQGVINLVSKYRTREDYESVRGIVESSFLISVPVSITAGLLVFFSSDLIANQFFKSAELVPLLKIFAFTIPFYVFSRTSIATTVGYKEIKYRVITNQFFQNIVQLVFTVVLIVGFGFGILGAAYGWLIGAALSSLLAFYYMRKLLPSVKPNRRHKELVKYSYPLFLSGIIGSILGWMDTTLLGYYMDDAAVGLYNIALPTAMLLLMPYQALSSLLLPSMSELIEKGSEEVENTMKTVTRWATIISFPAFTLMALFSDKVLILLFGQKFVETSSVLMIQGFEIKTVSVALVILSFSYMTGSAVGYTGDFLKAADRTNLMFKNSVIALFANLGLNLLLINPLGIVGAALATGLTSLIGKILLLGESYRFESVNPLSLEIWKPIVASTASLTVVFLAINSIFTYTPLWILVPGGVAFGILYFLTFTLLKGFNKEDKEMLETVGRKIGMEKEAEKLAEHIIR